MENRTIRVRGSAEVSGVPDWVVISFSVSSRHYEYGTCMERLAVRTESLREELASVGLERDSLKTSHFHIDTDFERVKEGSRERYVFKGYNASHHLKVEFPFEKEYVNEVLRVLSRTESEASFRISFGIKDLEPLRQQAIAGAVKNSKEKAQLLADAAGVALGDILQIDYSWSEVHFRSSLDICEMAAPMEAPDYDFTPDDVDVSDSVTVVWSIG